MIVVNNRLYRAACLFALMVFGVGLFGATVTGVWWMFENTGVFWAFLTLALGGFAWAVILDTVYRIWGLDDLDDLVIDVEPDDGSDA